MAQDDMTRVTACFNHKDRPGTVRCSSCLRPVCDACVIGDDTGRKYCSSKCLEGGIAARERAAELNSRPAAPRNIPVGSTIVAIAAGWGAWYAWTHWKALVALYHHYVG